MAGAIVFTGGDANAEIPDDISEGTGNTSDVWLYAVILCEILAIFSTAMFAMRRRCRLAYQTANGGVTSAGESLSRQQKINEIIK